MDSVLVLSGRCGDDRLCAVPLPRAFDGRSLHASIDGLAETLQTDANTLRIRVHDALLSAEKIVTISGSAFEAVTPVISQRPEHRVFPPIALQVASADPAPIFVVNNERVKASLTN